MTAITADTIRAMKSDELRGYLRSRGLKVSGSKAAQVERALSTLGAHAANGASGTVQIQAPPPPNAVNVTRGTASHPYTDAGKMLRAIGTPPEGFAPEYAVSEGKDAAGRTFRACHMGGTEWFYIPQPQTQTVTIAPPPPPPPAEVKAPRVVTPTAFAPLKAIGNTGRTATMYYRSPIERLHRCPSRENGQVSYYGAEATKEFGVRAVHYFLRSDGILQPASSQAFGIPNHADATALDALNSWWAQECKNAYSAFANAPKGL